MIHVYLFIYFSLFFSIHILNGSDSIPNESKSAFIEEWSPFIKNKEFDSFFDDETIKENKKIFDESMVHSSNELPDLISLHTDTNSLKNAYVEKNKLTSPTKKKLHLSCIAKTCSYTHQKILTVRCIFSKNLLTDCLRNIKKQKYAITAKTPVAIIEHNLLSNK